MNIQFSFCIFYLFYFFILTPCIFYLFPTPKCLKHFGGLREGGNYSILWDRVKPERRNTLNKLGQSHLIFFSHYFSFLGRLEGAASYSAGCIYSQWYETFHYYIGIWLRPRTFTNCTICTGFIFQSKRDVMPVLYHWEIFAGRNRSEGNVEYWRERAESHIAYHGCGCKK